MCEMNSSYFVRSRRHSRRSHQHSGRCRHTAGGGVYSGHAHNGECKNNAQAHLKYLQTTVKNTGV